MAFATTAANLSLHGTAPGGGGWLLRHLLRLEAWLDARSSRRALYRMDDRALADVGLSAADLERADPAASWQDLLQPIQTSNAMRSHRP